MHRFGLGGAQQCAFAGCARQLLFGARFEHSVFACEHRTALPHPGAIIDRDVELPEGTVIGYDQSEDKRKYFVTPSGLTVVTRDHSLYENTVTPDFLLET